MQETDLLVLGAGWTSTFLVPLLDNPPSHTRRLTYALTSTSGRPGTIKFKYDPSATDHSYFSTLPAARYILVTFPVKSGSDASLLVSSYLSSHPRVASSVRWIVLGSTGIWQPGSAYATTDRRTTHWLDRHSPYDRANARAVAEESYLALGALVLNLAGLWDGTQRDPKNWVGRVAATKGAVAGKTSLHMVHGVDVARALEAVVRGWEEDRTADAEDRRCKGQRWMLTDGFVYDWWALFAGWADVGGKQGQPSEQSRWVAELMSERGVKALPRSMEELGRCYDSREFWTTFGLSPLKARI